MRHNVSLLGESFVLFDEDKSNTINLVREDFFSIAYKLFFGAIELEAPKIIMDLGAHVGIFSTLLAKKFPESQVYAIEATKRTFSNLEKSIAGNNLTNIEPHNYTLWNQLKLL